MTLRLVSGEGSCYRKNGPCGGQSAGPVLTNLKAGQKYTVQFQQNLNHYFVDNPGWMEAAIAPNPNPSEADFKPFGQQIRDYNAMNMITQVWPVLLNA